MSSTAVVAWDAPLLARAYQAWYAGNGPAAAAQVADRDVLSAAYKYCEAVTAARSRTFWLASALLPGQKRQAMRALYAFCRVTDDIVDGPSANTGSALAAWRRRAIDPNPPVNDRVALAWADTRARYRIPPSYAEQLIDGIGRDLRQTRYTSFDELATYAYGVASTVGLMSMHIIGFAGEGAIPYAVRLGVALQLINILRDVGEDWRAGRLYLPLEELAGYGLTEADVAAGRVDKRWQAFMRAQIQRVRQIYAEAVPGIRLLHADGRFAVAAAGELYLAILDDIEAHAFDVFQRRAHVAMWGKLRRLPGIWWRSR